jgi:hypothetical protein
LRVTARRSAPAGAHLRIACGFILAVVTIVSLPGMAVVQSAPRHDSSSWAAVKCRNYADAWNRLTARSGHGIGAQFRADHEAFLASGCSLAANVCPRSPEELELANKLTIAAMNAGTASTFLPFACRNEKGRPEGRP